MSMRIDTVWNCIECGIFGLKGIWDTQPHTLPLKRASVVPTLSWWLLQTCSCTPLKKVWKHVLPDTQPAGCASWPSEQAYMYCGNSTGSKAMNRNRSQCQATMTCGLLGLIFLTTSYYFLIAFLKMTCSCTIGNELTEEHFTSRSPFSFNGCVKIKKAISGNYFTLACHPKRNCTLCDITLWDATIYFGINSDFEVVIRCCCSKNSKKGKNTLLIHCCWISPLPSYPLLLSTSSSPTPLINRHYFYRLLPSLHKNEHECRYLTEPGLCTRSDSWSCRQPLDEGRREVTSGDEI